MKILLVAMIALMAFAAAMFGSFWAWLVVFALSIWLIVVLIRANSRGKVAETLAHSEKVKDRTNPPHENRIRPE